MSGDCFYFNYGPYPGVTLGLVEAFSISGLKCYFGSNDHEPEHFEVLRPGAWVIRVFFLKSTRKRGLSWNYKHHWSGAVRARDEQEILEMVLAHRRRLLREWGVKVCDEGKNSAKHQRRRQGGERRA